MKLFFRTCAAGTDPLADLGENDLDFIHWDDLARRLPPEGVLRRFPTEEARLERLVAVRWPEEISCPRCSAPNPSRILTRGTYQCRKCRNQFSATSGTYLHGSRLSLAMWFQTAESMINYRAQVPRHNIPAHALSDILGCAYVTARRVIKLVDGDIRRAGTKILSTAICEKTADAPRPADELRDYRPLMEGQATAQHDS